MYPMLRLSPIFVTGVIAFGSFCVVGMFIGNYLTKTKRQAVEMVGMIFELEMEGDS